MIQAFGFVNGTHVSIASPSEHSHNYFHNKTVTYPEIFWEYCFRQGNSGQEPKRT